MSSLRAIANSLEAALNGAEAVSSAFAGPWAPDPGLSVDFDLESVPWASVAVSLPAFRLLGSPVTTKLLSFSLLLLLLATRSVQLSSVPLRREIREYNELGRQDFGLRPHCRGRLTGPDRPQSWTRDLSPTSSSGLLDLQPPSGNLCGILPNHPQVHA